MAVFFLLDYCLSLFLADNKLSFVFTRDALVDLLCWVAMFVVAFGIADYSSAVVGVIRLSKAIRLSRFESLLLGRHANGANCRERRALRSLCVCLSVSVCLCIFSLSVGLLACLSI
eukprot:GILJ01031726.1.p2 GENE.GILJ01031726.1~~GILJ01031726.1.p2  ORF type:complete len:116 (+),score=17.40 GILJ01031726.1:162-509(+)